MSDKSKWLANQNEILAREESGEFIRPDYSPPPCACGAESRIVLTSEWPHVQTFYCYGCAGEIDPRYSREAVARIRAPIR